jgi:Na+:H+ antiporter
MNNVALFLLSIAGIFLIGALGEIIFQRTNIPDVIWLIVAGIVLGPISGLVTRPTLDSIAPYFAALTLVVILFEGGSALKLSELSRAAPRSSLLALSGFVLAVISIALASKLAALVGLLPDTWTFQHGLLLGAILGGSSSIIVMPAMSQAKVEHKLANLVSLESALTDALCVVGTSAIIDVMLHGKASPGAAAESLMRSFGIGLVIGLVAGLVWLLFLRFLRSSEHAYPVTLSALLILYVVIDRLGGSAAMGILTVAVVLGNAPALSKKLGLAEAVELDTSVRGFHRQMAFIIKSFFFVFIGAMLGPPVSLIVLGVLFGGVLFLARVPAVYLSTLGSDLDEHQKKMAAVAMPRGMAAGVLATLPVSAHVPGTDNLPVIVFACVFTTVLVFAVGFPVVRRRAERAAAPVAAPALSPPTPAAARPAPAQDTLLDPPAGSNASRDPDGTPQGHP